MAHILIIEDQEPLRVLYQSVLRKYNHETTFTTTGEAGIEAALRDKPDLVILDLLLPGIPGIEVARRLQEAGILPDVPLIITTALDELDELDELDAQSIADSLNATAVLNKPFNIESILSTVNGALATANEK